MPLKGNLFEQPAVEIWREIQTVYSTKRNSRPLSSQLRNTAMFCHRLYNMVANQSAQESPQHSHFNLSVKFILKKCQLQ